MDKSIKWFAAFNKFCNENRIRDCFHADGQCSSRIVKAHSIQNKRVLSRISRDGDVLTFRKSPGEEHQLKPVGKGIASTFTGFCSTHDLEIFKPIDNFDYSLGNVEQEFLFAYRAYARGYNAKVSSIIATVQLACSKPEHFEGNGHKIMVDAAKGSIPYLRILEKHKIDLNYYLDTEIFSGIHTVKFVFGKEYPIAASSMFYIIMDMEGNIINNLSSTRNYISPSLLTIFPQHGKTFVLLSWLKKDKTMFDRLEAQILDCKSDRQKVIVSNILATSVENTAVSPQYWEILPPAIQTYFHNVFNMTVLDNKSIPLVAFSDLNIFVDSALSM